MLSTHREKDYTPEAYHNKQAALMFTAVGAFFASLHAVKTLNLKLCCSNGVCVC